MFKEEEARKRAETEEEERKRDLEMLIAKTTSPNFMQTQNISDHCNCGAANLSNIRQQLETRPRTDPNFSLEVIFLFNNKIY